MPMPPPRAPPPELGNLEATAGNAEATAAFVPPILDILALSFAAPPHLKATSTTSFGTCRMFLAIVHGTALRTRSGGPPLEPERINDAG